MRSVLNRAFRRRGQLFPSFVSHGNKISRNLPIAHLRPLCRKRTRVSEQRPPNIVVDIYANVEFLVSILEPFAYIGSAGEGHGKREPDNSIVEPLLPCTQPQ